MTIKWLALLKTFAICVVAYAIIGLLGLAFARAIQIQAGSGTPLLQQAVQGPAPILFTVLSCVGTLALFFGAGVLYGFFARREGEPASVPSYALGAVVIGVLLVILRFVGGRLIGSDPIAIVRTDQPGVPTAIILLLAICLFGIPLTLLSASGGAIYAFIARRKASASVVPFSEGHT